MTAGPDIAQAARQLSQSLSGLVESVAGYAQSGLDRLGGSLEAERRRRMRMLGSAVALIVLLWFGLLFAGLAVVAVFWETHRVIAIAAVAGGFFALAAVAGGVLWSTRRRQPSPYDWLAQLVSLFAEYRRLRR